MGESIAYFFEKKIFNTYYSKIICKGQEETESGSKIRRKRILPSSSRKISFTNYAWI